MRKGRRSRAESCKAVSAVQLAVALALGSVSPFAPPAEASEAAELEASVNFDIAAQPLDTALLEFSRQAGVQVLATESAVSGKLTRGVRGAYPVGRALMELLKGSGLKYRQTAERAVTIDVENGRQTTNGDDWLTLAQAGQEAGATEDAAGLDEVVVTGVKFRYDAPSSATKLTMDPRDIPQSLTLVTEDVMEFASIRRFDDIYRVDASAGTTHRRDNYPQSFYRGFDTEGPNAIRIDGFRFIGNTNLDLVGFERFEVVKGPTSALYGQNTLGGTLNAVTKQPQGVRAGSVRLEGGSHDYKRGEIDFTGPIDQAGRWKYRLVGAYQDTGSFVDIAHNKSVTVAPSLSFEPADGTKLVLTGYYNDQKNVSDWGTGLQQVDPQNGVYRILPLPRSHFFGQPWNGTDLEASIVTLWLDQRLSGNWRLRAAVQHNDFSEARLSCTADGNSNPQGVLEGGCWTYLSESDSEMFSGEVDLIGDFELLGRRHTLLLGVDYSEVDGRNLFGFDYIDDAGHGIEFGSSIGYDLTRPVGIIPRVTRKDLFEYFDTRATTIFSGVTGQLLLRPADRLTVLLAGRYSRDRIADSVERFSEGFDGLETQPLLPSPLSNIDLRKFVGQAGLTYRLTGRANAYLNWGRTYEPSLARRFDPADPTGGGILLPPEQGEQYELGLKLAVLGNRMDLTFAAFDMERSGISQEDRQHLGYSLPVGTQRSRGIELGAAGALRPGWELYASMALLDSQFIEGEFAGNHSANAPKRALSLFSSYQFQQGALKGFGIGMGYVYKDGLETYGQVFGHDPIRFDFGDINELDLRVFYNTARWEAYLAARDVLDDLYYAPVRFNEFRWGVQVNPGRTISAGLTYKLF